MRINNMNQIPKFDTDFITIYENKIDADHIINLINLVSQGSHELKKVERRPHLTMELPAVTHEKDNHAAMELRSIFYNILDDSLIDFLKRKNINKVKQAMLIDGNAIGDNFIIVSKMSVDTPEMGVHQDIDDDHPLSDSFIVMVYINDNFDNGEIYFPERNFVYKPRSGDIVYYKRQLKHGVNAVTKGERYTIGTSFAGPIE
jgi:hypothetical protein